MTQPDNAPLPDPGSGWEGLGNSGFGPFVLIQMVVKPLAALLSLFTGRAPATYEDQLGAVAEDNEVRSGLLGWVAGLLGIDLLQQVAEGVATGLSGAAAAVADFFSGKWLQADNTTATANSAAFQASSALTAAEAVEGTAAEANSTAEAAANAAAEALETADTAYAAASYWEAECVVASADVLLGVNELLIGLGQNVPTGKTRTITDVHYAFSNKPGTMTVEMKKWNAAGTSATVIHTANIGAGVSRVNYNNLGLNVADKERVFWNVTASSASATVMQALVFGVIT